MAIPSRRQHPRTNRLILETFERRDLLSATHHLLDALSPTIWSPVLLSMQTNHWTPYLLKIVDQYASKGPQDLGLFTELGKNRLGPHGPDGLGGGLWGNNDPLPPGADVQVQPKHAGKGAHDVLTQDVQAQDVQAPVETTDSAVQASTDSTSQTTDSTDTSSSLDSTLATLAISPTALIGDIASEDLVTSVATAAVSTTVDLLSLLHDIGNVTVLPMPATTITKGHGHQSGTAESTSNDGSVSQSEPGSETPTDAPAGSSDTLGTFLASTLNDGSSGNIDSLLSGSSTAGTSLLSATPYSVDSTVAGTPTSSIAVGANVPANVRASAGDASSRDRSSAHSTVVDVRSATAHEAYFANAQDLAHGRVDSDTSLNHTSAEVPSLFLSKLQSAENLTDWDRLSVLNDRAGRLDDAFSLLDQDTPATANSRQDSPLEVIATDVFFGGAARSNGEKSGADGQGDEEEVAASPVNASAHGADLLGSPLLFDLDSLAQQAQEFFAQIEQMGQDLAGLLGRTNLISGLVAIGLAASAIEVVRRRNKRAAHGIVLQSCTGTTFTCYPNLGGTWTWEES